MRTIKVNLKGDAITSPRAQAECGINYATISNSHKYMRKSCGVIKVILTTTNFYGKRIQKTYYCMPS